MPQLPTLLLLILLAPLLTGAALPLALAAPRQPLGATPACPRLYYGDPAALLAALPMADYACTEELAAALRPQARQQHVAALLALAQHGHDPRAQRNALRTLGRIAASPPQTHAYELLRRTYGAAMQSLAVEMLLTQNDNFLLQDAVWLLDAFYFPSFGAAPALEAVAHHPAHAPALRYRAASSRARLVAARPGALHTHDYAFIQAGLASADAGVRTAAANAVAHLRPEQQAGHTPQLSAALRTAWHHEPPLSLAADPPDARASNQFTFAESSPTSLSARVAIARARDHLDGHGQQHEEDIRHTYTSLALPHTFVGTKISLHSNMPLAQRHTLLTEAETTLAALATLLGPDLAQPLADASTPRLTIFIFERQGIFRDYMRAFTNFSVDVDGIYAEQSATIYTYQRSATQSANTLAESLRHEVAHHYAATHLFPGDWHRPGYHTEPKGWADEGLAELAAGWGPSGFLPRQAQLGRLCARAHLPPLTPLLARREGYDHFGHFDYDAAWAFTFYMAHDQPAALRRLYAAYRDGSYRLVHWETIAGLSLPATEEAWHDALRAWCN
ncbi:MAG: peptidase [Candidatus Viridilinea halotolerans]|uniref:Peptidase n=1 Tax=Candidatus Viridilinea halotolerans TaxID=2491704 RepID=A0A426TXN8_9CHLR|nr:MAG: peptidase [Candidatus Viridilinea halotolerans]